MKTLNEENYLQGLRAIFILIKMEGRGGHFLRKYDCVVHDILIAIKRVTEWL